MAAQKGRRIVRAGRYGGLLFPFGIIGNYLWAVMLFPNLKQRFRDWKSIVF